MNEILDGWIYPKNMKKKSYHDGEFKIDFPRQNLINMIRGECESKDDIIWVRNCALISKKSKFWFKEDQCRITDLDLLADNLDALTHDCILVSSYGARPVPSSVKDETVQKILDCPYIKKWFTQNYDGTLIHPKLFPYPIGFPAVAIWWVGKNKNTTIDRMLEMRRKWYDRKELKVFCDVHLLARPGVGKERIVVQNEIVKATTCDHVEVLQKRTSDMKMVYELYSKYQFVICTHGLGLDCHRTWEVFMTGGIIITKHSSMDYLYDDLPVIYVDKWDEVFIKDNLEKWKNQVNHLTTEENILPKMRRRYWIEEKEYKFNQNS
jgi:hypothetical protein